MTTRRAPDGPGARGLVTLRASPSTGRPTEPEEITPVCYPVTCTTCGRTTWDGCGLHADDVLASVAPEARCTCR